MKPLTLEQRVWVDNTLDHFTLADCVGHLLMPRDLEYSAADWTQLIRDVPVGSVFVGDRDRAKLQRDLDAIQSNARVPVVVGANVECGLGCGTTFPYPMALGAADDAALAKAQGQAVAREARALGIHWVFQPVVDVLLRFQNPELQMRAFGDKPARVRALAVASIRGLQEEGWVAATAKHFPGAGADDRDQHLCTVLNPLPMGKWRRSYGAVWRGAIDSDVMAIMTGHIALPDYEGLADRPSAALPATLSPRVQTDLLRGELGFKGVIVAGARLMTGAARTDDEAVEFVQAGGDVFVCADARRGFERLMQAVREGRLSESRVRESARRVLELKARVGLYRGVKSAEPAAQERDQNQALAQTIADRSVTVWKTDGALPARLGAGATVLTVTVRQEGASNPLGPELATVDRELRQRGMTVDHLVNPGPEALAAVVDRYARVWVNVIRMPEAALGSNRLAGGMALTWQREFWAARRNVVFTAFGAPFVIYEAPQWPNAVLAYGADEACQRAAVKVWLGEIEAHGRLPVGLPLF